MNTFYFRFFHNFLFHFFLGSSTENLHQFWGKHKLRHFSGTRHRTAFVEANPWNWSREQKHCTSSVMPRFHIPNFATRTIIRERCGWGATLCWKCLPSPCVFGFVWFLSPCPLEEVFVTEVAISLSFTVYGAISLFPRKQSSPDLQHPPWQTTF